MNSDQSPNQLPNRKPFVKMQIEKVNLRTTETMGLFCQRLSSSGAQAQVDPACASQMVFCQI